MNGLIIATYLLVQTLPAIENGACMGVEDADKSREMHGEEIVGMIPLPPVGVRVLIERADGTFKEMFYDMRVRQVCHVTDFSGDPRVQSQGA